ncbi:hypothetical protein E2C01_079200 [Portunus trituberculatus]|uniref:Uncharacterized protein n=1 Tax=Portunus trituberculatus TaxID=210409 RepID=A0A5B7IKW5_PORTR|nr:hypothetical protein [Portunus trituberculatus]
MEVLVGWEGRARAPTTITTTTTRSLGKHRGRAMAVTAALLCLAVLSPPPPLPYILNSHSLHPTCVDSSSINLISFVPIIETVAPSEEAQPTLRPWTGFEPVRLESPWTPKHAWFHCTTAATS